MRKRVSLTILLILTVIGEGLVAEVSQDSAVPEAKVSFDRSATGVNYTISIAPPFKMNRKAPFKFELRKSAEELIRSVPLEAFTKEKDKEVYRFTSTAGEKRVHYWFIACKYKGDEIIACKTFAAKEDIPEK